MAAQWTCFLISVWVRLYSSPNIVWVISSRRMRWAGHVARMGDSRGVYRVLVGKPEEENFDILLTVHLIIFILVINQLDAQNFDLQ